MTDAPDIIRFSGAQTIAGVEQAHRSLTEALAAQAPTLEIDCSGLEECDLAFVQLLLAARRSCKEGGRSLRLTGSPVLAAACAAAGIDIALFAAA